MNINEWSEIYKENHSLGWDFYYGCWAFLYAWLLMLALGACGLGVVGFWPAYVFIVVARYIISAATGSNPEN